MKRRKFAAGMALSGLGLGTLSLKNIYGEGNSSEERTGARNKLKISLNAYSFDKPLREGKMSLNDLLEFCRKTGFDGVDITGYYFPGYPVPPADEVIYSIRKKAFRLGLDLGCTGVKNDFTWSDKAKREEEKMLVKEWIMVAHKLGAPGLRIFSGILSKENFSWEERAKWIADDIRECADFSGKYGVMLALQNHNDFIKTSEETERLLTLINHEWVGLMLDIGSYRTSDPYRDIAANSKYAITWQMKEKVFVNDSQVDTDYNKIIKIVDDCGYKGYLPLETLGEGDPYQKVDILFKKVSDIVYGDH
jgi:sugar phosphate isomerase/epimerase